MLTNTIIDIDIIAANQCINKEKYMHLFFFRNTPNEQQDTGTTILKGKPRETNYVTCRFVETKTQKTRRRVRK